MLLSIHCCRRSRSSRISHITRHSHRGIHIHDTWCAQRESRGSARGRPSLCTSVTVIGLFLATPKERIEIEKTADATQLLARLPVLACCRLQTEPLVAPMRAERRYHPVSVSRHAHEQGAAAIATSNPAPVARWTLQRCSARSTHRQVRDLRQLQLGFSARLWTPAPLWRCPGPGARAPAPANTQYQYALYCAPATPNQLSSQ
eukprot:scaffold5483_cov127-Isochrysis_galbana.AAC.5